MLNIVGLLMMALAGLLQASVLPVLLPTLAGLNVRPDLPVLLVVAAALALGLQEATIWAFAGGLFLDLLGGGPLGSHALCLILAAVVTYLGIHNPFRAHLVMPLVMVFLGTFFYYLLLLALRTVLGDNFSWASVLTEIALPTALFNMALMPLVYSGVLTLADRFAFRLPQEWQ